MIASIKTLIRDNSNLLKMLSIPYNFLFSKLTFIKSLKCKVSIYGALCKNRSVKICGKNHIIVLCSGSRLVNCNIVIRGTHNTLIIGERCRIANTTLWLEGDFNEIRIGDYTTMEGGLLAAIESTKIFIGEDCMLSYGIEMRTGDSHGIYSEDGIKLNYASNISLGNHVWVGAKSTILKGGEIPSGCIIGHSSLVTKAFVKGCSIYGGNPAKLLKENINWTREK